MITIANVAVTEKTFGKGAGENSRHKCLSAYCPFQTVVD